MSSKLFITEFGLFFILIILLFTSTESSEEYFTLPTEGSKSFPIDLEKKWHYSFEVTSWAGDEIINISVLQGEEIIFSVLLEGDSLELILDPENGIIAPPLGEYFQVEETGKFELVAQVIVEPSTESAAQIKLYGQNQYVLGFDIGPLIIALIITLICGFFALVGSSIYETYQMIKKHKSSSSGEEDIL